MNESKQLIAALNHARRFNANDSQPISQEQAEAIENNKFLRSIALELNHVKTISTEKISELRNIFSSFKHIKALEKYFDEVISSLRISNEPELVALAQEFNTLLIENR